MGLLKKLARLTKDTVMLPVDVALDATVPRLWRDDDKFFRTPERGRRLRDDLDDLNDWLDEDDD